MGGSTKVIDTNPKDVSGLRSALSSWLMNPGPGQRAAATAPPPPIGGQGPIFGGGGGMFNPGGPQPGGQSGTTRLFGGQGDYGDPNNPGGYMGRSAGMGLDPKAIAANPGGYDQWRQQAGAAGYNYGPQGQNLGGPAINPMYPGVDMGGGGGGGGGGYNPGNGGNFGPGGGGFDRLFGNTGTGPGRVDLGGAPQMAGINPLMFNGVDLSQIPMVGQMLGGPGGIGGVNRTNVRDVNAPTALGAMGTASVDSLGGANSAFFRNMQNQLSPAFTQQRNEAIAAARQAAGNLTGSGYANTVGTALNRSLGDEQARLADYAVHGIDTEVGRQTALAGINSQRDISNQGMAMNASLANQGADQNFLNFLLGRGQLTNQAGMSNQDAITRTLLANSQNSLNAGMANQNTAFNTGKANMDMAGQYGLAQGGMDQQRNLAQYSSGVDMQNQNAQRFLQMLMGMSTAGIGQGQVVQKGGIGSVLGGILGTGLGAMTGGLGTSIAGKILK